MPLMLRLKIPVLRRAISCFDGWREAGAGFSALGDCSRVARQWRYNAGMRRTLKLHPDSRCAAGAGIAVEVARSRSGNLTLQYVLTGRMSELSIPPLAAPRRADELWRHTCFEAFLRAPSEQAYYEFNFAPSGQWAAYRFTGYRTGMSVAHECAAPQIEVHADPSYCEVRVLLDLDRLSGLPRHAPWRLALAAVIEDSRGGRSYWALAHPPGKPDFHHPDCFVHELPAVVYS